MDLTGLQQPIARLDGVDIGAVSERITLACGSQQSHTLVVTGEVVQDVLYNKIDPADGRRYVAAGADHLGAPTWLARFGDGTDKSAIRLEVRCPGDWTVVISGGSEQVARGHWRSQSNRPLAAHLAAFAAGPFHTFSAAGLEPALSFHVRASAADRLDRLGPQLITVASSALAELSRLLGTSSPLPQCDVVYLPNVVRAAMEFPGCMQLDERLLPDDADNADWRGILVHELAHLWFGHLVTPLRTSDVWIFEALSEYFSQRVTAGMPGTVAPKLTRLRRQPDGFAVALLGAGSLQHENALPTRLAYVKGAAAVTALGHRLGERTLLAGLRGFLAAHADGRAGVPELISAFRQAGALGLNRWCADWLDSTGVGEAVVESGRFRVLNQPAPQELSAMTLTGWRAGAAGEAADLAAAALFVAERADGWWRMRFSDEQWRILAAGGSALASRARHVFWTALQCAVAGQEVCPELALDISAVLLESEDDAAVLDVTAGWVARELLPYCGQPGEQTLAGVLGRIMTSPSKAADIQSIAGRYWLDTADVTPLRKVLPRLEDSSRWRALTRLAVLGQVTADDVYTYRERGGVSETALARCRAAIASAEAKSHVWQELCDPRRMTVAERSAAVRVFWHPRHKELTEPFVERYFQALAVPGAVSTVLAFHGFPISADPEKVILHVGNLLSGESVSPAVAATIGQRVEAARRRYAPRLPLA